MGNPYVGVNGRRRLGLNCLARFQDPLQGFQPAGLARRLVPAQPVDARSTFLIEFTWLFNLT